VGVEGVAVAIECPYCDHRVNLKAAKPGRFRPNCPKCGKAFFLLIPEHAGAAIQVRGMPSDTMVAPIGGGGTSDRRSLIFEETPVPDDQSSVVAFANGSSHTDQTGEPFIEHAKTSPGGRPVPGSHQSSGSTPPPSRHDKSFLKAQVKGYAIERELGRGGMGFVYLARQLSLNRPVALKVMSKRWATDPVFVARFTREAYAAAQLSHPNIVQIHDIGEVEGTRFFSMEYVRGRSLSELVRNQGKLDPETAVGYVLQAARGLKHAHDRGMIHRDVKPDNLLLDEQGLVKVADLGLVKTPTTQRSDDQLSNSSSRSGLNALPNDMTGARIALGTPAYMSPEQCRDAATVDQRADIYSLGCTLYVMVTGRPPFQGTTDVELMTKHVYDALVPPEQIVARVPKEVSAVIQRMMAKHPDDRFQTMGEVIRTLEAWLGVHHTGTFSPQEEQISKLEMFTLQFNDASTAVLRRRIITGFFSILALTSVLILFFGKPGWAFGLVGLAVQSMMAYFVLDGIARRGHFFTRTRQFLMGLSWGDWVVGVAGLGLFCILLAMLKVFWIWIGFGVIGIGLGFALRYGLDRGVEAERRSPLEGCERLLRRLRVQGLDEEELRQFVAKFAGRYWEEFFETIFGYEAKLAARAVLLRGGSAGAREKHASWREPLIAAMERIEKSRREARERKLLQSIEQAQLLATGASPEVAENQARAAAEAMVQAAGQVREAEVERVRVAYAQHINNAPVNVRSAVLASEQNPFAFVPTPRDPAGRIIGILVGPQVRAAIASLLLTGCALWVHQNALIPEAEIRARAAQAVQSRDLSELQQTATRDLNKPTMPLVIKGIPVNATNWLDGWNAGFAGLLLFGSLFYRGNLMGVFALLGAAVAAAGYQYGIRTVEPFRAEHIALMLGSVLALIGFRVGTR
jgi:serine/threonine protein kinase